MPIVLVQRIDYESDYDDIPFVTYHFPIRYINQIKPGDIFIYYQGDRYKKANRYYFGVGVIGMIEPDVNGDNYYASIMNGIKFPIKVPIHQNDGSYYETIDYGSVRANEWPPWQSSIRALSEKAFSAIVNAAGVDTVDLPEVFRCADLETASNPFDMLEKLNLIYKNATPEKRISQINNYIDRGNAVVKALKLLLGAKCQVCDYVGFLKTDGSNYIEAHHINQLALSRAESLCSDNIILVCPNCHRELHYGKNVEIYDSEDSVTIRMHGRLNEIKKNKLTYLEEL